MRISHTAHLRGRRWLGSGAAGATLPSTIFAAIRARIRASSAMSSLSDAYLQQAPRKPVHPYLIFNLITDSPDCITGGPILASWMAIQFTIIDTDTIRGRALREALPLVWPKAGANMVAQDGTVNAVIPGPRYEFHSMGPDGNLIWRFVISMNLFMNRNNP